MSELPVLPGRRGHWQSLRRDVLWLALVAIAVLAPYALLVSDRSLLVFHDASEQTWTWWTFNVHNVQQGHVPLWNPYVSGGQSNIGEGQTGSLYPPMLIAAALHVPGLASVAGLQSFVVLHGVVAAVLAYFLVRALGMSQAAGAAAAITFALGGMLSGRILGQANIYEATAWVPGMLAAAAMAIRTRRWWWCVLSGLAGAMSLFAGHVQPLYMGLLMVVGLLALSAVLPVVAGRPPLGVPRALGYSGLSMLSTLALSAPQLLPILEYQRQAVRFVGTANPYPGAAKLPFSVLAANEKLPAEGLLAVVFHQLGGVDAGVYLGGAALVLAFVALAAAARQALPWALMAATGIVLAAGASTPVLHIWYLLVPGVDKLREPVRYLQVTHMAVSVLVALGINALVRPEGRRRVVLGLLGGSALLGLALIALRWRSPHVPEQRPALYVLAVSTAAVVLAVLVVRRAAALRVVPGVAIAVFLAVDLGRSAAANLPRPAYNGTNLLAVGPAYHGPGVADEVNQLRALTSGAGGPYRAQWGQTTLPRNLGVAYELRAITGFSATLPTRFFEFLAAGGGFVPGSVGAAVMGVRGVASPPSRSVPHPTATRNDRINQVPDAAPYAWLPKETVRAAATARDQVAALSNDPKSVVRLAVLDDTADKHLIGPQQDAPGDQVVVDRLSPGHTKLTVTTAARRLLVVEEPWFRGWQVRVRGHASASNAVDYVLQGIEVPPGTSTVTLDYEPRSLTLGCLLAALFLVGTRLWALQRRRPLLQIRTPV